LRHLLVTNDFPPKIGGIQSYLWELWRRLPADDVTVLTSGHRDAEAFDAQQDFNVVRIREPVMVPSPVLVRRIRRLVADVGAQAVLLDPALPLGAIGPSLGVPYAVVLHGAEVTVPGRLPATRHILARVVRGSSLVIAAGNYPAAEARRAVGGDEAMPPLALVPPGVDPERFVPLARIERAAARARFGLAGAGPLVVSVSRLVPRKGMDTLIDAATIMAAEHPDLQVAIAGEGRDQGRLERRARRNRAPVKLLGHISHADLPSLYACADVFSMSCRSRWGGLEQEGFGIVFLEAAAAGVPSVAGDSGGAAEAVVDGETGLVVRPPDDAATLAAAISRLLADPAMASSQGQAARRRAETEYSYDLLAERLRKAVDAMIGAGVGPP
jgi:phosphatidylinositol alpha-1,6-mannosyltransferase